MKKVNLHGGHAQHLLRRFAPAFLYGAAMMANYFAAQEPNEKSHEEYAIHKEMYFTTVDRITTAKINTPAVETDVAPEIYLHNFGIPLSIYPNLLGYGLEEYRGTYCIYGH